MSKSNHPSIPRRTFLVGGAAVVGSVMVSLSPKSVLGHALRRQVQAPSIAFWDGQRLVSPEFITGGYSPLDQAIVTIRGFGGVGSIQSIDVNFSIETQEGTKTIPYHAWKASSTSTPMPKVRFSVPVDPINGLSIIVFQGKEDTNPTALQMGGTSKLQLREGLYVFADGSVKLGEFRIDHDNKAAPLTRIGTGNPISYVILEVSRP